MNQSTNELLLMQSRTVNLSYWGKMFHAVTGFVFWALVEGVNNLGCEGRIVA